MKTTLAATLMIVIVSLISNATLFAQAEQTDEYQDIVLLGNGASITGKITERVEGEKVVIRTREGQEHEVPWWRIELISTVETFEEDKKSLADKPKPISPRMTGYNSEIIIQFGAFAWEGEGLISPTLVAGVMIDERLYCGGGLGWELMGDYRFTTLFVDYRRYFERQTLIPYLYVDAGYAFGSHENYELGNSGGFTASFGIGLRSYVARRGSVN